MWIEITRIGFWILQDLLSTQEGEYFKTDFDGFHMREQLYEKFPISHFYWRIVLHVVRTCTPLLSDVIESMYSM